MTAAPSKMGSGGNFWMSDGGVLALGSLFLAMLSMTTAGPLVAIGEIVTPTTVATTVVIALMVLRLASLVSGGGSKNTGHKSRLPPAAVIQYPIEKLEACKNDKERFVLMYDQLRDELVSGDLLQDNEMSKEGAEWCHAMMDYNVPGGKLNRGTTVMAVVQALMPAQSKSTTTTVVDQCLSKTYELHTFMTPYTMAKAAILGWTIEFLQAFFLVADDIMDDSQMRRGQPCWYKRPGIGMIAINDAFLLESFVFCILKRHFGSEPYFQDLVQLMLDVIFKTECGQLLDLTSQPAGAPVVDLDRFTATRYQKIVKYKTAFYSFYLPVAMGLHMCGAEPEAFEIASTICCQMGEYFQVQDDVLDCFGDPAVIGKVGTDIQENKCSWLVVQALQRCNSQQRAILQANYGVWDDSKVAKVKAVYRELNLSAVFDEYEKTSYQLLQAAVDQQTVVPRAVFEILLKKIYKRKH